jgi:hypothetical protein
MPGYNPVRDTDVPDVTDPEDVMDKLEPETRQGPFGIPYVKPKGGPDLPGTQ